MSKPEKADKKLGGNIKPKINTSKEKTDNQIKPSEKVVEENSTSKPKSKKEITVKKSTKEVSVQDLIKKIEEMNQQITLEDKYRVDLLNKKQEEIVMKESQIFEYGDKNKMLIKDLESMKIVIDKQLSQYGMRDIHSQMKIINKKKISFQDTLINREKELKNVNSLIGILKNEKKNLERGCENNNFSKVSELSDKVTKMEKQNIELENQIKNTNRQLEESNKIKDLVEAQQKEKGVYQNEIRDLKNKISEGEENCKNKKHALFIADLELKKMRAEVEEYKRKLPEVKVKRRSVAVVGLSKIKDKNSKIIITYILLLL